MTASAKRNDALISGPWLSAAARAALPTVRREFDLNRDPLIASQVLDLDKSEAQRREETGGRGSRMVQRDKPDPAAVPPEDMRHDTDRAAFRSRWLVEQRDAVLANAATRQTPSQEIPAPVRSGREPAP